MLAYRRIPRDAQIADDLSCVGCGYNLRGVAASGRCPECGSDVEKSLYVLAKPRQVAAGLRAVAWSYLTLTVLAATCLIGFAAWLPSVLSLIALGGAMARVAGAWHLRFNGALEALPATVVRVNLLFFAALAECALLATLVVMTYLIARPTFIVPQPMMIATFACGVLAIAAVFASQAIGGSLGLALARLIGHRWIEIEFKAQIIVIAACTGAVALLFIIAAVVGLWSVNVAAAVVLAGSLLIAPCATGIPLMHLANAAEQEEDELQVVVE